VSALSEPDVLRLARGLRGVSLCLELGLWAVLAGSALLFGGVHEPVYVAIWHVCALLAALLLLRARLFARLRRRVGALRVTFHASGGWLIVGEGSAYGGATGWSVDLSRPPLRRGPLLLPGLLFAAWTLLQLVPLPPGVPARPPGAAPTPGWSPVSVDLASTGRGLVFVLALLALHAAAGAVLDGRAARERFRAVLAGLAVLLAGIGLVQKALDASLVYGVFQPLEWHGGGVRFFGPFINRNHFAAWMLMATPIVCGRLVRAWQRLQRRSGAGANLRRRLLALQSEEGVAVALASVPALAAVAALVATGSRGGLLAFLGAALLAPLLWRGRGSARASPGRALLAVLLPVALVGLAVSWFGTARVGVRFEQALQDSVGRTAAWSDTLRRLDGLWLHGSGFNTFQAAMSSSTPWTLPEGSTPWTPEEAALGPGEGYYVPEGGGGRFREAHNDYLQLLVESGVPGLALALWALGAALGAQRRDLWALAAVLGPMLHCLVDFPAQIPAVAALFAGVAALPERGASD
jgi:O-antigen ligase